LQQLRFLSALRRSTRARTGEQRAAAAANAEDDAEGAAATEGAQLTQAEQIAAVGKHNESEVELFEMMAVPNYCQVLCEQLEVPSASR